MQMTIFSVLLPLVSPSRDLEQCFLICSLISQVREFTFLNYQHASYHSSLFCTMQTVNVNVRSCSLRAELLKLHILHLVAQSQEQARKDKTQARGRKKGYCPQPRLQPAEGELGMEILAGQGPSFLSDGIDARKSCIKYSCLAFLPIPIYGSEDI